MRRHKLLYSYWSVCDAARGGNSLLLWRCQNKETSYCTLDPRIEATSCPCTYIHTEKSHAWSSKHCLAGWYCMMLARSRALHVDPALHLCSGKIQLLSIGSTFAYVDMSLSGSIQQESRYSRVRCNDYTVYRTAIRMCIPYHQVKHNIWSRHPRKWFAIEQMIWSWTFLHKSPNWLHLVVMLAHHDIKD